MTQTLRQLEANGLVERRVLPMAPAGTEYRLTELGCSLLEPVRSLSRRAEAHTDALLAARNRSAVAADASGRAPIGSTRVTRHLAAMAITVVRKT